MPRDYKRVPSPRSQGSGSVSVARSGTRAGDLSSALLKGSAGTRNAEPFTPEVRAAYAAFSGITDELTARRLWRKFVTWDDVSDYVDAGVGVIDYDTMIALKSNHISPASWSEWREVLPGLYPNAVIDRLKTLVPLLADPKTYALWYELDTPISGSGGWRFSPSGEYANFLSLFQNKCYGKVEYERAVVVAEALLIAKARSTKRIHDTSQKWVNLMAEGMDPVRAAALIYAGVTQPSQASAWNDRSVSAILSFALLQTEVPHKVIVLAGMADEKVNGETAVLA